MFPLPPRQRQLIYLAALLWAAALVTGCGQLLAPRAPEEYQPTAIPTDVTELFRVSGNADSDTVWVYEQGGPLHELAGDPQYEFMNFPNHQALQFAHVHQTLTLENDLATRYAELSLANLKAEVDVSVEILHRTIRHFQAEGKRVVVIGHSFGALLTTRYLALKGPGTVDRFVIMAGRLDMPAEVVDGALNGVWHHFPDGVTPERHPSLQPEQDEQFIELRIAGATAHARYTERLANTDLRRVIYVYGTADEQIGRLSEAEDAFLRSKGSTVITVEGGHHGSMFEDPEAIRKIVEALQQQPLNARPTQARLQRQPAPAALQG